MTTTTTHHRCYQVKVQEMTKNKTIWKTYSKYFGKTLEITERETKFLASTGRYLEALEASMYRSL
jgi:hypothetical protein